MTKEIEVERNFVVTYNCHSDEYTFQGSKEKFNKPIKGWEKYAEYTHIAREMIRENKGKEEVTWGLRKSFKDDLDDYSKQYRTPQTIKWTLKVPGENSTGIYIFVNSDSGTRGDVIWNLSVPEKELTSQLSPRVINHVQWKKGSSDFSGMGRLSPGCDTAAMFYNSQQVYPSI